MIASELKFHWAAKRIAFAATAAEVPSGDVTGSRFAVVLDSDDRLLLDKFSTLKTEFRVPDENFVIMSLMDLKTEDSQVVPFCSADVGWRGRINNDRALDFLRNNYEVLLVFTAVSDPLTKFVVQATRAELKIGREEITSSLYDLSISTRSVEVDLFLEEVRKYLRILRHRK